MLETITLAWWQLALFAGMMAFNGMLIERYLLPRLRAWRSRTITHAERINAERAAPVRYGTAGRSSYLTGIVAIDVEILRLQALTRWGDADMLRVAKRLTHEALDAPGGYTENYIIGLIGLYHRYARGERVSPE